MIVPLHQLAVFALAALVMVLSPGPNMMYLVSRALCQGANAAVISLVGVAAGFLLHMVVAAFGLTAFFLAVPYAYNALRFLGAAYLLWLAWQAIRPGAAPLFKARALPPDSVPKLLWMGFLTNALNPKIAVFYVSIFSQFLDPGRGSVLEQSLVLGTTQIAISFTVNFAIIHGAGAVSHWLTGRPTWARLQRWIMASVLGGMAVKLALTDRK